MGVRGCAPMVVRMPCGLSAFDGRATDTSGGTMYALFFSGGGGGDAGGLVVARAAGQARQAGL